MAEAELQSVSRADYVQSKLWTRQSKSVVMLTAQIALRWGAELKQSLQAILHMISEHLS